MPSFTLTKNRAVPFTVTSDVFSRHKSVRFLFFKCTFSGLKLLV
jgi:hypothetical protein